MKITDKSVKRWLRTINCLELYERIDEYPEDERDGRSDIQFFADELSYAIENYNESGHCWNEDLEESRRILRETRNGKCNPLYADTLRPKYRPSEIESAKSTVNEYNRMTYRYAQLKKEGITGSWW
jgi:hypothetical protein